MTDTAPRSFHLGDVLSITTGILMKPRGMDGVEDILAFMTGEASLFTHQLPRAARICAPWLLSQHPALGALGKPKAMSADESEAYLAKQIARYGETLEVTPLPAGVYQARDPLAELEARLGKDRVLVVVAGRS